MKRKWIVELPGHIYDTKIIEDQVLLANENRVVSVDDEGKATIIFTHDAPIYSVKKTGDALLMAAEDKRLIIVDNNEINEVNTDFGLFSLDYKDGKAVAGGCCGALYLISDGTIVKKTNVGGHVYDVSWWSDKVLAASFDGHLYLFDSDLNFIKRVKMAENVNTVRPCGGLVAVGTFEPGGVFVLDEDLEVVWSKGGYLDVRLVAWREGCKGLYVGSWDGVLSLYDEHGNEVLAGKGPRGVESGDWRDGRLAVSGWGRTELYEEEGDKLGER